MHCIVVLIYKNERINEDLVKIDIGIESMSIMMVAQNFEIESMCLGVVEIKDTQEKLQELFGIKKNSLLLGVALGKPKEKSELYERVIKCKVFLFRIKKLYYLRFKIIIRNNLKY